MAEYRIETAEQLYIPMWDNNRERDDSEQIRVYLRWLKTGQRSECFDTTVDDDGKSKHRINYRKLVAMGVSRFEQFRVNGKPIETATEFLATPGFEVLLMEIGVEVLNANPIIDQGN